MRFKGELSSDDANRSLRVLLRKDLVGVFGVDCFFLVGVLGALTFWGSCESLEGFTLIELEALLGSDLNKLFASLFTKLVSVKDELPSPDELPILAGDFGVLKGRIFLCF